MDTKTILKNTKFTPEAIMSALKQIGFSRKSFYKSVAEFVWNGFDAGATKIDIGWEIVQNDKNGRFRKLIIIDNGKGINSNKLSLSFEPIFDSEKKLIEEYNKNNISIPHGKNGVGRLTFFTFSNRAKWDSFFLNKENKLEKVSISINVNTLDKFSENDTNFDKFVNSTGTRVIFDGFEQININDFENNLINYLSQEFCWFLELNPSYSIKINKKDIDYSNVIEYQKEKEFTCKDHKVQVKYIKWKKLLNKEYSKFYFLDSNKKEVWKETTKLNKQGDDFHHSVYLQSKYFDDFNFKSDDSGQKSISGSVRSDKEYMELLDAVYSFLRDERKPFLKKHSEKIFEEFKTEGIIKPVKPNTLEEIEAKELELVFKELYVLQPKFFNKLKLEQKKIFIGFIDKLLQSDNREDILTIVDEIVNLSDVERKELIDLLKVTRLDCIIKTISLLKKRYEDVKILKQLVFEKQFGANERDHIQKIIELDYWLFGEQYHLVSKDEDFQKVLEKYVYLLDGQKVSKKMEINSKKRMDIFMCQRRKVGNQMNNVIIELKHPKIKIGRTEVLQVDEYRRTILKEPRFKSNHGFWEMYLVGTDFSDDNYIEDQIKTNQNHGEKNLIFKADNFKIYAKRWSDIFDEFEINHDFLNQKLELEREKLVKEQFKTAEEATKKITG